MATLFSKTIDFDQPFQRLTRGILAPPEGMVPNFEPKNDLKKGQICVLGRF